MTSVSVYVRLGGADVRAGALHAYRRRGAQSATFSYASEYLALGQAYALDPALPLVSGAHQAGVGRSMFGCFTDCAPDRWGRTLVARREVALARAEGRAARALGEIDYLLGVRDDLRQGCLRFRARDDGPFLAEEATGVPALTDLPELLSLAQRAERDTADLPAFSDSCGPAARWAVPGPRRTCVCPAGGSRSRSSPAPTMTPGT
jgi:serine/threonine-protein kinase HipA